MIILLEIYLYEARIKRCFYDFECKQNITQTHEMRQHFLLNVSLYMSFIVAISDDICSCLEDGSVFTAIMVTHTRS